MPDIPVQTPSREELEVREDALLQVLDVLRNWTEDEAEQELAEVRFLLGEENGDG